MVNKVGVLLITIINGNIKILLEKDDYGKWVIPSKNIIDDFDSTIKRISYVNLGYQNLFYKQVGSFINCDIIYTNYVALIDSYNFKFSRLENLDIDTKWFSANLLPKLDDYTKSSVKIILDYLKDMLLWQDNLRILFPNTFTLPELKKVYDSLYYIDIDRRNFRKKLLGLDIVSETDMFSKLEKGRPAKLYKLNDGNKLIYFKEDL